MRECRNEYSNRRQAYGHNQYGSTYGAAQISNTHFGD